MVREAREASTSRSSLHDSLRGRCSHGVLRGEGRSQDDGSTAGTSAAVRPDPPPDQDPPASLPATVVVWEPEATGVWTKELRFPGIHTSLDAFASGLLGGEEEDGQQSFQPGAEAGLRVATQGPPSASGLAAPAARSQASWA